MTRLSIKKHHEQYLQLISEQMGVTQAVALDYLIFELRRSGFSFSSQLSSPLTTLQAPTSTGMFVPFQEVAPATAPTADQELDEVVLKFAALLEEF
jgi:hypothetical protein